jgi:hypothetical protein
VGSRIIGGCAGREGLGSAGDEQGYQYGLSLCRNCVTYVSHVGNRCASGGEG